MAFTIIQFKGAAKLDISRSEDGITISVGVAELEELGVTEEELRESGFAAQLFIAGMALQLMQLGLMESLDDVGVTVIKRGERLILKFTPEQNKPQEMIFPFDDVRELGEFCRELADGGDIPESLLLRLEKTYMLWVSFAAKKAAAPYKNRGISDSLDISKIKEHGRVICNAPIEKIADIYF